MFQRKNIFTLILKLSIFFISCAIPTTTLGQNAQIYKESIASLQVVAGDDWLSPPVTTLGGLPINISFDDLTHEYHRYTYSIEHCEANWTPSTQLFESDFLRGFAEDNIIKNFQKSVNTKVQYTHYSLQIPNAECQLKMSGNYRLTVYDANNDNEKILSVCFMVVEPLAQIGLDVTDNTDWDIRGSHQQVNMTVRYGNLSVTDPQKQLQTVVLQNGIWTQQRFNIKPQYITPEGLRWEHNEALIFDGGNEYRKFETLDVNHPTMGIETVGWDGTDYHAYVWTDEPRPSYVYDEDANGSFYIRNSDNIENNTTSEYQIVHFRLRAPQQTGEVYLHGNWTHHQLAPEYRMTYNRDTKCYEGSVLLKQGYYSYQYVVANNQHELKPVSSEGNFYQTENKYQALLYFRGAGERTDRLVGYQQVSFKIGSTTSLNR